MNLGKLAKLRGSLTVVLALALVEACTQGTTKEFLGPNAGSRPPDMVRLSVTPRVTQVVLGDSIGFVAFGHFGNGDSAVVPATWSSTNGAISDAGRYHAVREGADTVWATSKAHPLFSYAAALEVVNPLLDLAVVRLSPEAVTLSLGHSLQFAARATLPDGTEIAPELTWSSTGGTITSSGLFSALGQSGTYNVTAQIKGRTPSGAAWVTVLPPALAGLALNPASIALVAGETRQFTVSASWANGSTTVPALVWSATGGTVTPSGLYTAGPTSGPFRVIVAPVGGGPADTSAVTILSLPATLSSLTLAPATVALTPGANVQLTVAGIWSDGSETAPAVTYSATGGAITAEGLYTAGATPGVFRVIGTQQDGTKADTSIVTISAPAAMLLQLVLNPASLTLASGATRQFAVAGTWSDGTATVPAVSYSSTGGTITAGGLYVAGATPGTYRVIATHQGGTKADTAAVTVSALPPTLTQLVLNPASLTLAPSATQPFSASGTWSNGSTSSPAVIYSATGGTITPGGLYAAGATPGTYRVIATHQGGTKADTAAVTVSALPLTLTQLVLNPGSLTLAPSATQQFSAAGTWSNGSTSSPPVTYSATGGTITAGGLYAAGATPGTYRVIATHQGGTKADTASITVTSPLALLLSEGFESGNLGSFFKLGCCAYSGGVQQTVRRSGLAAARVELRSTDPITGASHRSELRITSGNIVGGTGSERWYGLSIYIPSTWQVDTNAEDYQILAQWHNLPDTELGEGYTPPPLAIWIDKGDWSIWSYWDPNPLTQITNGAPAAPGGRAMLWRGPFARGTWTDWVVHVKWSFGTGGLLEVWKDGQLIVSRTGPNTYNDSRPLYFMAGIYKWMWDTPSLAWSQSSRVAFFDEFRIAGTGGSYAAVAPR